MIPRTFEKKPVQVEALQWSGSVIDFDSAFYWMDEDPRLAMTFNGKDGDVENVSLTINTLEGVMRADPGDWVIKGVNGEFYPCKPDIFEKTYLEVPTVTDGERAIEITLKVVYVPSTDDNMTFDQALKYDQDLITEDPGSLVEAVSFFDPSEISVREVLKERDKK